MSVCSACGLTMNVANKQHAVQSVSAISPHHIHRLKFVELHRQQVTNTCTCRKTVATCQQQCNTHTDTVMLGRVTDNDLTNSWRCCKTLAGGIHETSVAKVWRALERCLCLMYNNNAKYRESVKTIWHALIATRLDYYNSTFYHFSAAKLQAMTTCTGYFVVVN